MGIYQLGRRLIAASGVVEAHLGTTEGEWVVLSRLALPWAQDAGFLERFGQQAPSFAVAKGPGVAELIEFGSGGDGVWFAERTGDGEPLRALMTSKAGVLTQLESISIVEQLALALARLHDRGVVHGDPSASSVFVTSAGAVSFLHTGFAKIAGRSDKRGPARSEPHAIAPEQLDGSYTASSDVFRLGLMLLEMLNGLSPFVASEPTQVLLNASRYRGLPENMVRDVPRALRPALEWMLQADPSQRPRASEVPEALQMGVESLQLMATALELGRTFQRLMADRQPPVGARTTELRLTPPRPPSPPPPVARPSVSTGIVLGRVQALKPAPAPSSPPSTAAPAPSPPSTSTRPESVAPASSTAAATSPTAAEPRSTLPAEANAPDRGQLAIPESLLVEAVFSTLGAPGLDGVALVQLSADVAEQLGASKPDIARARFVAAAVVVSNLRTGAPTFAWPSPKSVENALGAPLLVDLGGPAAFIFEGGVLPNDGWARAVAVTFALARECGSTCPAPWQPVVAALEGRFPHDVTQGLERVLAR